MKKMNLPNKLTVLRIALVPLIIAAILIDFPLHFLVSGLLFGAAAITDAFDGKIARRDNLITDFGKFADPLADKILVISVLVCFTKLGLCGAVPLIIIIFREFAVTSVRLVAAAKGKVKTVSQIVAIVAIFVMQFGVEVLSLALVGWKVPQDLLSSGVNPFDWTAYNPIFTVFNICNIIGQVLIWISAVITVISGVKYLVDNKNIIADI